MAFIVPVVVSETLFTSSRESLQSVPRWLRGSQGDSGGNAWVAGALGVFCRISKALNAQSALEGLASAASALGVHFVLAILWRRTGWSGARFRDLLPSPSEAVAVGALLGVVYLVLDAGIRPEALPRAPIPDLSVWILYSILIALFMRVTRRSLGGSLEGDAEAAAPIRLRAIVIFLMDFGLSLVAATSVKPVTTIAVLMIWAVGCAVGAFLIAQP